MKKKLNYIFSKASLVQFINYFPDSFEPADLIYFQKNKNLPPKVIINTLF
jgi:hypothetical protein